MLPAVKNLLRRGEAGLTFVDLLVTITVIAIVTLPLVHFFTASYAAIVKAGRRTVAVNLCREKMEVIKSGGYSCYLDCIRDAPGGIYREMEEPPGGANSFRRETELRLVDVRLAGNQESASIIGITVIVTWGGSENECAVKLTSLLAKR